MKYYHHKTGRGKGGCTIAYKFEETVDKDGKSVGKQLKFSVGLCSYKDVYCKKKGRDSALKQWNNNNILSLVCKNKPKDVENHLYYLAERLTRLFDKRISY